MEEKLLNSNVSRTFYTQKLLPGAGVTLEMFENKEKKTDKFLSRKDTEDEGVLTFVDCIDRELALV